MPDYEGYTKSLEAILDGVKKDYWCSYVDINRHQVNVGRTYLWVSAALLGVYVAGFDRATGQIMAAPYLVALTLLSFALACVAFGTCLYAIPARNGYKAIPNAGWGEFSERAYDILSCGSDNVYATFLTEHISKIDHAFAHNFKTNQRRAKLLRQTSWLLIASFTLAVTVALSVLVQSLPFTKENLKVSNDKTTTTNGSAQPASPQPQLNVPKPPPPANIGGGNVSTHSLESFKPSTIFTTDSAPSKK